MEELSRKRGGRFTSSQIYRLTSKAMTEEKLGKTAMTYVNEAIMERKMGDSLDIGFNHGKTASWGHFMELRVARLLRQKDVRYGLKSSGFKTHPNKGLSQYWGGSSDFKYVRENNTTKIAELKSYQKKKFAQYTEALLTENLTTIRKDFPAEYWQIVSNCIVHGVDVGEAITYLPYQSEYEEIKEMAYNYDEYDMWKYRFIYEEPMRNLPFQPNDSQYKNLNIFTFEIPKEDKEYLTWVVEKSIIEVERKIKLKRE